MMSMRPAYETMTRGLADAPVDKHWNKLALDYTWSIYLALRAARYTSA